MRMPPLLADFIHTRVCELKCEKFLTRPTTTKVRKILDTTLQDHSMALEMYYWLKKIKANPALNMHSWL